MRLVSDGRTAALTIADSGPGLAELREHLFQPFAAGERGGSSGLGRRSAARSCTLVRQHRAGRPRQAGGRGARCHGARAAGGQSAAMSDDGTNTRVRLDKWQWAARFHKTRSGRRGDRQGRVEVNGRAANLARGARRRCHRDPPCAAHVTVRA